MHSTLFQAICKVGIFMICAQAIVHFRPQEAYEKYMKLLVSVMVLIQLFLPIGGFLLGDGMGETAKRLEAFREELEQEMKLAEREAQDAERVLESMTLGEIRKRLQEQEEEKNMTEEQESGGGKSIGSGAKEQEGGGESGGNETKRQESGGGESEGNEGEEAGKRGSGGEISVGEISVTVDPITTGSED